MPKWERWLEDEENDAPIEKFQPIRKAPKFDDESKKKDFGKKKINQRIPRPEKE